MATPNAKTVELTPNELIDHQLTELMGKLRHAEAEDDEIGAHLCRARIDELLDVRSGAA